MKKLLFVSLSIILGSMAVYGQGSRSELVKKINEIKAKSDLYYWNQYTHTDADSAKINASRWMLLEINNNRSENDQLTLEQVMPLMKYVKITRGANTQYFAYIRKSDVAGSLAIPTPADSPVATSSLPVQRTFVPDAFVQKVCQYKEFYAVYNFLKSQKAQKQILQFGPLKDVEDYSSMDLILFDMQSKELVSMLSAEKTDGTRTNLITGQPDSLDNYPEDIVLVIWYIK